MPENKTLILGIGNYLLGDEGIGCHAISYLEERGCSEKAELMDGGTGGFHLMDHLMRHNHVILIDATLDNLPEGTVRVLRPKGHYDLPTTLSAHEIGLKDLISSLALLDAFPDLYLIAISVKDYNTRRITLSDTIAATLPEIHNQVNRILAHIEALNSSIIIS
jgi:hydrogenase maturation protease